MYNKYILTAGAVDFVYKLYSVILSFAINWFVSPRMNYVALNEFLCMHILTVNGKLSIKNQSTVGASLIL